MKMWIEVSSDLHTQLVDASIKSGCKNVNDYVIIILTHSVKKG